MPISEDERLARQLEDLGKRLRKRTEEFKTTGGFSFLDKRFLAHVERHNDQLRTKAETAVRSGSAWQATKTEIIRDVSVFMNDIAMLEGRLDAESNAKGLRPR